MPDLSSSVAVHIRSLIQSLNGSNSNSLLQELYQFCDYGLEGSILTLQSCLDHINIYGNGVTNDHVHPAFASLFRFFLGKPNFSSVLCQSLRHVPIRDGFLDDLSNMFSLSLSEKIAVGLALSESENADARLVGTSFCTSHIESLFANPCTIELSEQIQNIFMFLHRCEGLSKHVDTFTQMLSLIQPKEDNPFALAPLFLDELKDTKLLRSMDLFYDSSDNDFDTIITEMEKEISMADVMKELGYGCSTDASKCNDILSLFLPLTEVAIARILGVVVRTHAGLEDNNTAFSAFVSAIGSSTMPDFPHLSSWNVNILVDSIKQLAPDTNWVKVMENLDHDGFYIPSDEAFSFFMTIYKCACQELFPLHAICGSVWKNSEGQLSFLKHAVSAPPDMFTFSHSIRKVAYVDVHGLSSQLGQSNNVWLCLDLLDVLCQLAESGHASTVRSMLEYPLKQCPEVLLLGIAQIHTTYNLLQYEVSATALPMVIANASRKGFILHLWHLNHYLVLRGFVDALTKDSDSVYMIIDICQEIKIINLVLEQIPFSLGIRLAAVASQKELLDLEKWLNDNIITSKETIFEECLKYVKEIQYQTISDDDPNRLHHTASFSTLDAITTRVILKVLEANAQTLTLKSLSDEIGELLASVENHNLNQRNDGVIDSSPLNTPSGDIETEANSYFQRMFSDQQSVDEMIQMLTRFKESSVKREQSVFDCMISNLFEEYRFFPKYPEKQLGLAAILFGSVIKHQLVTHLTLGIALRCVLDSLRKPADSKMFAFGTKALEQFIGRLEEWPQYCNHILQISHLRSTHPKLVEYIDGVLARKSHGGNGPVDQLNMSSLGSTVNELIGSNSSQSGQQLSSTLRFQPRQSVSLEDGKSSITSNSVTKPPIPASGQSTATSSADTAITQKGTQGATGMLSISPAFSRNRGSTTRFGSALNIETLEAAAERRETPIEAPSSEIQDKISFIINNISVANVETKAKEFSDILKEQYYPWFAQYMVMKRASIEPNFHELYLKFLDKFNSKALNKEIVQATYENCRVLLGSELIKSSSEERSLLKNLGSWLGKLTIGRNQVLRARDIDPKALIIEAYEKGLMIAVIPFTSKILEPCQNSLAYQPPNPWTMGILGLLAEIYAIPNLKMNLKFDIEVLFKNLGVSIKDVTPSSLLKERIRVNEGNPDFSNKDAGAPPTGEDRLTVLPAPIHVEIPDVVPTPPQYGSTTNTLLEDDKLATVTFPDPLPSTVQQATQTQPSYPQPSPVNLDKLVVVNPKLQNMGVHFQRVLPLAMDRAIKEIVNGIVQRSVSIASQTTKELVIKDYAFESDESRIYSAAHLMVASLAGSLAHVTCKEPLRASISSQLRNMLQGLNIINEMLEQTVQLATNDNLDLGCAVIEQAATDKAIVVIDNELKQRLALRRKHRENSGSSMYDSSMYAQGMGVLPETLRPTPGRLSDSQQRVYLDFGHLPWQNQQSSQTANTMHSPSSDGGSFPLSFSVSSGQISSSGYPPGIGNSSFAVNAQHIDLGHDEMDQSQSQAQLFSPISLNHIRGSDSSAPLRSEVDSIPMSLSSTPALESQSAEPPAIEPVINSQLSSVSSVSLGTGPSDTVATGEAPDKCQRLALKLSAALANDGGESEIQSMIADVPQIIMKCGNRDEAALSIAQKIFKALYENGGNSFHVNAHLAVLAAVRDVCKLVVKELTTWVIHADDEQKFNKDITVGLMRRELLNLQDYNIHMTKLLDTGRNKAAMEFAVSLLQTLAKEEPKFISELQTLYEALAKLAARPGSPESLQQLVETVKNPAATAGGLLSPVTVKDDMNRLTRDKKVLQSVATRGEYNSVDVIGPETSSFQQQVSLLFAEWYRICELPSGNDAPCAKYMLHLHQNGLLRGDDKTERFFRVLLEISVSHFGEVMQKSPQVHTPFLAIDIYAKLVYSILKYWPVDQGANKFFLLPKIFTVTVRSIQKDADEKKEDFNPRPYFRLFINWLLDIGSLDPVHDGVNFPVLSFFANAFHLLQPLKVPAFSFAWLELVSHRTFMPKLLAGNSQKGWPLLHRLLMDLFQFMEPFLRNAELGDLIRFLYKGTLRVLLVLLHDFPEFLCDYHFSFCDVIPSSCIQMRNIILSAFPCNMRLPDPSTPNLKIDLLAEMSQAPRILSEVDAALRAKQMKADVDEYLKMKQGPFPKELKHRLLLSPNEVSHAGTRYNVPLINSVVLYVGMQAIQLLQAQNISQPQSASGDPSDNNPALGIFQALINDLDTEGRYLFLNAIANQLRYPNTHTHYFSFIILFLFSKAEQEIIQEQITRVLLERLIVNRPHPWGLLITFIELIKNPSYHFWSRSFTRCAPEIEKLFESVSRSCGGPKPVHESMVGSGALSDGVH